MAEKRDLLNHATEIGQLIIAWNDAQHIVLNIFRICARLRLDMADGIFFALRADNAQRDIAEAAAAIALEKHPATLKRTRSALQQLSRLSGSRNAATHTMWWLADDESVTSIHEVYPWLARRDLKDDFDTQFEKLFEDILNAQNDLRDVVTEISEKLKPLPRRAHPPRRKATQSGKPKTKTPPTL